MSANRDIPTQRGRGEFSGGLQLKHTIIAESTRRKFNIDRATGRIDGLTAGSLPDPIVCNTGLIMRYRHPYDYLRDASMDHLTFDAGQNSVVGAERSNEQVAAKGEIPLDRDHRRHYINQHRQYALPEQFWNSSNPEDPADWKQPQMEWGDVRRKPAAKTEIVLDMDNGRWLTPGAYKNNSRILMAVTKPRAEKRAEEDLAARVTERTDLSLTADRLKYSFVEVNGASVSMTKLPRLGYMNPPAAAYNPYAPGAGGNNSAERAPVASTGRAIEPNLISNVMAFRDVGISAPIPPDWNTFLNVLGNHLPGGGFANGLRQRLLDDDEPISPVSPADVGCAIDFALNRPGEPGLENVFHQVPPPTPAGWLAGLTTPQAYAKNRIKSIKADDEHGIRLRVAQPSDPAAAAALANGAQAEATLAGADGIHPDKVEELKGENTGATLNLANSHASMHFNHAAIVLDDNLETNNADQQTNARIKLVSHSGVADSQNDISSLPAPNAGADANTTFIELNGNQNIVAKCGQARFKLTQEGIEMRFGDRFIHIDAAGIHHSFGIDILPSAAGME
jgi:hypothetical protein